MLLHPIPGCLLRSKADAMCQLKHSSYTATRTWLFVSQPACTSCINSLHHQSAEAAQQSPACLSGSSASEGKNHSSGGRRCRVNHIASKAVQSASHAAPSGSAVSETGASCRTRGFRAATLKPSLIRRLRRVHQVITMLDQYSDQLTPRLWNTALCHLVDLVHNQQQTFSSMPA